MCKEISEGEKEGREQWGEQKGWEGRETDGKGKATTQYAILFFFFFLRGENLQEKRLGREEPNLVLYILVVRDTSKITNSYISFFPLHSSPPALCLIPVPYAVSLRVWAGRGRLSVVPVSRPVQGRHMPRRAVVYPGGDALWLRTLSPHAHL